MNIAARQTLFNDFSKTIFVDPYDVHKFIKHSSKSDTAIIRISELTTYGDGGPYTMQLILTPISSISSDKKFLLIDAPSVSREIFSMNIIGGGWRFSATPTVDSNETQIYLFAATNGQHGSGHGSIPVTTQKTNIIVNGSSGEIFFNNQKIQDISTTNIPIESKYYISRHYELSTRFTDKIERIEIMGKYSHDWGNLYAKFYHFRLFDKNMNMICNLWPKNINGQPGIYDECTKKFWTKTHLTGDFVFGTD